MLLVNRKVTRIFCGPATALEEIEQLEDDTHGQHQQGGRSQANYQRSVEQEKLCPPALARHAVHPLQAQPLRPPGARLAGGHGGRRGGPDTSGLRERLAGRISIDVENTGADEGPGGRGGRGRGADDGARARGRSTAWRRASGAGRAARRASPTSWRHSSRRAWSCCCWPTASTRRSAGAIEQAITQSGRRPGGAPPRRPRATRRDRSRAPLLMARALLIVDFQNDFTPPDGALAVPDGDAIAARVDRLARSGEYDLVVATRDWHPRTGSFAAQGRPVARALRAGRRRRAPSCARPGAGRRRGRQGPGPGHRGLLRLPGHAPRRAPARARRRARDGGRAGDGLLRQEHRAGRAAGLRSPWTPRPCAAWTSRPATPTVRWRSCARRGRASRRRGGR